MRHRKSTLTLLIMLALLLYCIFAQAESTLIEEPTQLARMLSDPSDTLFVDVRSEKEFNLMHIAGFQNRPYDETDWDHFDPGGRMTVLICQSGIRSAHVQEILVKSGYTQVLCCTFGVEDFLISADDVFREGYAVCIPCLLKQKTETEKELNEQ